MNTQHIRIAVVALALSTLAGCGWWHHHHHFRYDAPVTFTQ